jgi:hypothetical protein
MERYRGAMEDMLARVLASGAECIVMTPCHMCSYVPSGIEAPLLKEIAAKAARVQAEGILRGYAQLARDAAARHGAPVADAYAAWDALAAGGVDTTALLSNGINHPSREMHDVFVLEILKAMFAFTRFEKSKP